MKSKRLKTNKNPMSPKQMELFADAAAPAPLPQEPLHMDLQTFCRDKIRMSSTAISFDLAVEILGPETENK